MVRAKQQLITLVDVAGLLGIAFYCLGSALFSSDFAEIHIQPSCLDFPIFLGEIVAFILFLLCVTKIFLTGGLKKHHYYWAGYLVFILIYAFVGYKQWGALALRNAALFYYAAFALFAYEFYHRRYLTHRAVVVGALALFIVMLFFRFIGSFFWFSVLMLTVVIILKAFPRQWWLVIPVVIFSHLDVMFVSIRAHMVAIFSAVCFLLFTGISFFIKGSFAQRLGLISGLVILLTISGFIFSDQNAVKSMTRYDRLLKSFQKYDAYVEQNQSKYYDGVVPYKLYHENSKPSLKPNEVFVPAGSVVQPEMIEQAVDQKNQTYSTSSNVKSNQISKEVKKKRNEKDDVLQNTLIKTTESMVIQVEKPPQVEERNLDVATNNILFRIFIWRDMWVELTKKNFIFGIGFGQPQRSKSLEILEWGDIEWLRDGWVAPHNSFFHMIYRAGILGLLIVIVNFMLMIRLVGKFIKARDFCGIILLSVLVYWSMVTMFSVTLELPYNAVFYWCVFGFIMAYANKSKEKLI